MINMTYINENIESLIKISYHCLGSGDEDASFLLPILQNYSIQNWTSSSLTFKLFFTQPLYVSTFGAPDKLSITFLQQNLFLAKLDKHPLTVPYSLYTIVPTQMASEADFLQIQGMGSSSQNAMLLTLIIPFCFMVFMSFSMAKVWELYKMMQLITNISNYKTLSIPANLSLMLSVVQNIVGFSVFSNSQIQVWMKKHVFGKMERLQQFLIG